MTDQRLRLVGRLRVPLPPSDAFRLFTARGEIDWVEGWDPRFPVETGDDAQTGTVFVTSHDRAQTVWVVVDGAPEEGRIRYARTTPGHFAGTVVVTCRAAGDDATEVEVAYDITKLDPDLPFPMGDSQSEYDSFLKSWEEAIRRHLSI